MDEAREGIKGLCVMEVIWSEYMILMCLMFYIYKNYIRPCYGLVESDPIRYSILEKILEQVKHLQRLYITDDKKCLSQLRLSCSTFARLYYLIQHVGGLNDRKYASVGEQVAMFLHVLGHHTKNRTVGFRFMRSGDTVSVVFKKVMKAVLKLYPVLLAEANPVTGDCDDDRWCHFQCCLGALDGTYVQCHPRRRDKPRFRTRKDDTAFNVLGVCDRDMKFVHVLSEWKGSAADSRVLRDAISRPGGLRVPTGNYYLVDGGYANSEGFLAPFREIRYHLKEWEESGRMPQNYKEYFNLKHAMARNVIERAFGLLKTRWAILRSKCFYSMKSQNHIILACFLLHNYARMEMPVDPLEDEIPEELLHNETGDGDYIEAIEPSPGWTNWREELAQKMYSDWRSRGRKRVD